MINLGRLVIAILSVSSALSVQAAPKLDCPCSIEYPSKTSLVLSAGVVNSDTVTTGDIRLAVQVSEDIAFASFFELVSAPLAALAPGQSHSTNQYRLPAEFVSASKRYYYRVAVNEKRSGVWSMTDAIRMESPSLIGYRFGEAYVVSESEPNVFLPQNPSFELSSDSQGFRLTIPEITTDSKTLDYGEVLIQIYESDSPVIYGANNFVAFEQALPNPLLKGASLRNIVIQDSLLSTPDPQTYLHLVIKDSAGVLQAWQTVYTNTEQSFSFKAVELQGIDYLTDTDSDGSADYTERLAGTNPASRFDTPGTSTVRVLLLQSQDLADSADYEANLAHITAYANTVLDQSGVDIQIEFTAPVTYDFGRSGVPRNTDLLDRITARQDPFTGLNALIRSERADMAIFLDVSRTEDTNCGVAWLSGLNTRGDVAPDLVSTNYNVGVVDVDSDFCSSRTLIHEIGHLMGLGHSRKQGAEGTYAWSVGHGEQDRFASIMAYDTSFGNALEFDYFSSPDVLECDGRPCGIDRSDLTSGADAAATLNAVRYQVANVYEGFAPSLTLLGARRIELTIGDTFTDPGAQAFDWEDGDLTSAIVRSGIIDTTVEGSYTLRYSVRDADSRSDTVNRTVVVVDPANLDSDSDGIVDLEDAFVNDPAASIDFDGDGLPDEWNANATAAQISASPLTLDEDDDNDGVLDGSDAFPLDPAASADTDGDRQPDDWNLDASAEQIAASSLTLDVDDDNDGVSDLLDLFPLDSAASADLDKDGLPDDWNSAATQAQIDASGLTVDDDDDNDGVLDSLDAFPLDASESRDTDKDGLGDRADTDDDGDGVVDSLDAFPLNKNESSDNDKDGIGNNADSDDDNDGYPDTADAFVFDESEWLDTDADGVGNNADTDDDNDGVPDAEDRLPLVSVAEYNDFDADGLPNSCDADCQALGLIEDLDDDNDGVTDVQEGGDGTNPLDPTDYLQRFDVLNGAVFSWSNGALLESVVINRDDGTWVEAAETGSDGRYQFGLAPESTFTLVPELSVSRGEVRSVVTAADALATLKIAVGLNPDVDPDEGGPLTALAVSPYQLIAADIDSDGKVTAGDALAVLKLAVGLSSSLPPRWAFVDKDVPIWESHNSRGKVFDAATPATVAYPERTKVDFVAVLVGDVDASWAAPVAAQTLSDDAFSALFADQGVPLSVWRLRDTDEDGLSDEQEAGLGTAIDDVDTDADGVSDLDEVNQGTDPLVANNAPQAVFESAAKFADSCVNPRSGTNPATGALYPDQQGTAVDEKNWLRSWSNDTYLWFDEITDRDPSEDYSSRITERYPTEPNAYFSLLKTDAVTSSGKAKDSYHFVLDSQSWYELSQGGVDVGYGLEFAILNSSPPRDVRVAFSHSNSFAAEQGIGRGAQVVSINGVQVESGDPNLLNAGLRPDTLGERHEFEFIRLDETESVTLTLTAQAIELDAVQAVKVIPTTTGNVGYLAFHDHTAPAEQALVDAINLFAAEGVADVVVDLRYNGGGYLDIASELAYMIAGAQTQGKTFEALQFNEKHPETNPVTGATITPIPFYSVARGFSAQAGEALPSLNLSRVFVLTGRGSCSASEALINGLRGIEIDVIQIGDTTCGKPYGFYPTPNCGSTYFTVQFKGVNAEGFGDYPDGFTPSQGGDVGAVEVTGCSVADDFSELLGSENEARLRAALHYRDHGSCPPEPVPQALLLQNGGRSDSLSSDSTLELANDGLKSAARRVRILDLPR